MKGSCARLALFGAAGLLATAVSVSGGDWVIMDQAVNAGTNRSGGWASAVVAKPGGNDALYLGYEQFVDNTMQWGVLNRWDGRWVSAGNNFNSYPGDYAMLPSLAVDEQNQILVGYLEAGSDYFAYTKRLNGTQWDWIGSSLTATALGTSYVTVATAVDRHPGGFIYTAYSSNSVITVNRWTGSSWDNALGTTAVNHTNFPTHSLAVNGNGQPFLAWYDLSPGALHVRTWVGAAPTDFPDAVFRVTGAPEGSEPKLYNDPAGGLFLAYVGTGGPNNVIVVMRYNGAGWTQIGATGDLVATTDSLSSPCLAMDDQQRLHVAWLQWGPPDNVWKLRARIREAGTWQNLGGPLNVTANRSAYNPSLVMFNNQPVAVWDELDTAGNTRNVWAKQWFPNGLPTPTPTVATAPPGETSAYPLPASTTVNFAFNGTATGAVTVRVYNTHYRLVKELTAETATGTGSVAWDVSAVAPGIYLYQLTVGGTKFPAEKLVIAR